MRSSATGRRLTTSTTYGLSTRLRSTPCESSCTHLHLLLYKACILPARFFRISVRLFLTLTSPRLARLNARPPVFSHFPNHLSAHIFPHLFLATHDRTSSPPPVLVFHAHTLSCALTPCPSYNTFASAGSDGTVSIWDHKSKKRLRQYPKYNAPVPTVAFNCDGTRLAVGVSYTWENGEEGARGAERPAVFVKAVGEEVKVRPRPRCV